MLPDYFYINRSFQYQEILNFVSLFISDLTNNQYLHHTSFEGNLFSFVKAFCLIIVSMERRSQVSEILPVDTTKLNLWICMSMHAVCY